MRRIHTSTSSNTSQHQMNFFLLLSILICILATTNAKVESGDTLLTGENSVALLTKFAVSASEVGHLSLQFKIDTAVGMYTDERFLKVTLFNDQSKSWPSAKKKTLCAEKLEYATDHHPVVFNNKVIDGKSYWVAEIDAELAASRKDMYWYVTLNDCNLEQSFHSIKDAPQMHYSLTIMNGNSHVSADETGMGKLHLCQILSSSLLLLYVFFKIARAVSSKKGQIHVALLLVASAVACDIASGTFEMLHAGIYAMNGLGSYSFDCLASHFEAQCDALIALVLLLVGAGWTLPSDVILMGGHGHNAAMMSTNGLVQRTVAGFRSPFAALRELKGGNPAAILVVSILLFHAGLAQWGRTFDDDFDTYHSLEHTPGRVLMRFRVGLGLVFLCASSSVRNNGRCPQSLQPFLKKFQLVGFSWFLSLPFVSSYVSTVMHSHQKHIALAFGSMLVQSSSLASLVWLFTADKDSSAYHRMSTLKADNDTLSSMNSGNNFSAGAPIGIGSSSKGASNFWKFGNTKVRLD